MRSEVLIHHVRHWDKQDDQGIGDYSFNGWEFAGNTVKIIFCEALVLSPDSAVEKSGERNLGRYGVEKWDGGNDIVGMAWSLVGKRPFQLRRNRKSV